MRRIFDQHQQQQNRAPEPIRANDVSVLFQGTSHVHNEMTDDHKEQLKDIHKTDQKIDEGVKEVEEGIDRLQTKAQHAHAEVMSCFVSFSYYSL